MEIIKFTLKAQMNTTLKKISDSIYIVHMSSFGEKLELTFQK